MASEILQAVASGEREMMESIVWTASETSVGLSQDERILL